MRQSRTLETQRREGAGIAEMNVMPDDDFDDADAEFDNEHGWDCDCEECLYEYHLQECGRLPEHLGGGCQLAGTEHCDFECPFRDETP